MSPTPAGPLRILLAIPLYPPVIGGAEIHASRLAAALSRRGHDVRVLTTSTAPMPATRRWRDAHGVRVTAVGGALPVRMRPRAFVAEVAAHVARQRPHYDVVQLFLPGLHVVAGLAAARLRGTASAVMFGSSADVPRLRTLRLGRLQLRAIRHWADAIVVLNDDMRRDFVALGIPDRRMTWLPCSVDTARFRPATAAERAARRSALQLPDDSFVVAFVGRLVGAKNLPALLRGVGALAAHGRPVLCLVGDGPERASLERLAAAHAPGRVRFLGARTDAEVAHLLQASDVFALLSHVEGIPCALIEAMASGLPCVVRDIPSLAQLVTDGVHGVLLREDDPRSIAGVLGGLADDPTRRCRLGQAGRELVHRQYGVDAVAGQHEHLYRQITSCERGPYQ